MARPPTGREKADLDLLRRYREHDDLQAREELAERCVPLVRAIARQYAGRGEETDDLEQAGMLGLSQAIARYDPDRGHRFVAYAAPTIQGEIRRHFRDRTWAVHVPRTLQELDARVRHVRDECLARDGREPGTEELARAVGATVREVEEARVAGRSYATLGLDRPAGDDGSPADVHGGADAGYERIENADVVERAIRRLSARERQILLWRFRDDLLQREIAERVGVSQMQVSRIIRLALSRMREDAAVLAEREPAADR
jgi:RNA polymerase sigma-B factor